MSVPYDDLSDEHLDDFEEALGRLGGKPWNRDAIFNVRSLIAEVRRYRAASPAPILGEGDPVALDDAKLLIVTMRQAGQYTVTERGLLALDLLDRLLAAAPERKL